MKIVCLTFNQDHCSSNSENSFVNFIIPLWCVCCCTKVFVVLHYPLELFTTTDWFSTIFSLCDFMSKGDDIVYAPEIVCKVIRSAPAFTYKMTMPLAVCNLSIFVFMFAVCFPLRTRHIYNWIVLNLCRILWCIIYFVHSLDVPRQPFDTAKLNDVPSSNKQRYFTAFAFVSNIFLLSNSYFWYLAILVDVIAIVPLQNHHRYHFSVSFTFASCGNANMLLIIKK